MEGLVSAYDPRSGEYTRSRARLQTNLSLHTRAIMRRGGRFRQKRQQRSRPQRLKSAVARGKSTRMMARKKKKKFKATSEGSIAHQNLKDLTCRCPENPGVGVVNAVWKPFPLKEVLLPLQAVYRLSRFPPEPRDGPSMCSHVRTRCQASSLRRASHEWPT